MSKLLEKHFPPVASSFLLFLILLSQNETRLGFHSGYLFLFAAGGFIQMVLCSMQKRNRLITALSGFLCLVLCFFVIPKDTFVQLAAGFSQWLTEAPDTEPSVYSLLLVCIFTLISLCFQLVAERFFPLRLVVSLGLTVWMGVDLFTRRNLPQLTVTCSIGYLLITLVILIQLRWKKHRSSPDRPFLLWFLPFLTVYIICLGLIPAPEHPYNWQFAKELYKHFNQTYLLVLQNLPFGEKEGFSSTGGFRQDGRLLGEVTDNNRLILWIKEPNGLKTNLYLTGKVYDSFSGNQWSQTNTQMPYERKLDALETIYAVRLFDELHEADYIRPATFQVQFEDFRTSYVFSPLKTWKVLMQEMNYEDANGELLFENLQGYGATYENFFFQLNIDHDIFYTFLETPLTPDPETWKDVRKRYIHAFENTLTPEDLEKHRQDTYTVYNAPVRLSPKVQVLLDHITRDEKTDIEKLKAIEAYLSAFPYTDSPGALPEDIQSPEAFLDYFLLESKQGFCSYFATAFVLLSRAEGIPARYVEGFCIPTANGQEIPVYGNMAHAWPEVYIDQKGWIPFEPTPGFSELRYTPWEPIPVQTTQDSDDWEEENEEELPQNTAAPLPTPTPEPVENVVSMELPRTLGRILLLLIGIGALLFMGDRMISAYRYRRWSLEKKFHSQIQQNLLLLGLLGYRRNTYETLEELQERARAVMHYDTDTPEEEPKPLQFLTLYEEVLYNNRPVDEQMLELVNSEHAYLLSLLKKFKYPAYLYYRIMK